MLQQPRRLKHTLTAFLIKGRQAVSGKMVRVFIYKVEVILNHCEGHISRLTFLQGKGTKCDTAVSFPRQNMIGDYVGSFLGCC